MPQRNWTLPKSLVRLALVLMALVSLLVQGARQVTAQSASVIWSLPVNLSNTPQSSVNPAIIADDYGNVHVFWSEDVGGDALRPTDLTNPGNTIYYRRWDGSTWSQSNDILLAPNDPIADYISVAIDKNGYFHVVWTGQSNIYYSNAPLLEAGSARAWHQPEIITPSSSRALWESSVAADNDGKVHIIYATRGSDSGVFHIASADNGATWSQPIKLSEAFDSLETAFSRVKLIVDAEDRLQAVWQTTEVDGYGQAIYYTRSVDHGDTWSRSVQMAYRQSSDFEVSWPYIMSANPSDLYLVYGAGSTRGRYERISHDGGATWSDPQYIISEMEGVNGYIVPLIDSAGHLHLIIDMRPTATQKVGLYYSSWLGTGWSPVSPLVIDTPAADSAHYTAAVIRLGNEIHVVWNQARGGEIWYLHGSIQNVPQTPARLLPTPAPTQLPATVSGPLINPTPVIQRLPTQINQDLTTTSINSAGNSPVIPGVIAALALVAAIVAIRRFTRQR